MSTLTELINERNKYLYANFKKAIWNGDLNRVDKACIIASSMKSPRYWVTSECVAKIIYRINKGDNLCEMKKHRKYMFLELYELYKIEKSKNKNESVISICDRIVYNEATSFFITPYTSIKIITRIRNEKKCRAI